MQSVFQNPKKRAEWIYGQPMRSCPICGSYNMKPQMPIKMDTTGDETVPQLVGNWVRATKAGATPLEGPCYYACWDCGHKGPAVDCTGRTSEECRADRALNAEMKRLWNEQPHDQAHRGGASGAAICWALRRPKKEMTMFDEEPAGDPHGECAAEIARLRALAEQAREALEPFADIGAWLFARNLPDDTPLVDVRGLNGAAAPLTRGHFKAAHAAAWAIRDLEEAPPPSAALLRDENGRLRAALRGMLALDEEHHQRFSGDEDVCAEVRAAREALAPREEADNECDLHPLGWRCTRGRGHSGPCAAVECPEDVAAVERGMTRLRDTPAYGPDNPPRLRKPGESVEEYRAAMGWSTKTPNA